MEYASKNIKDTHKLAEKILKELILKHKQRNALIVVLKGDLGVGKTEFVKGLKNFLKIKNNILSPTFVLMKVYDINNIKVNFKKFYHFDLYRLIENTEKDIWSALEVLNIQDILNNRDNIVFIEWGEKLKKLKKISNILELRQKTNRERIIKV